MEKEGLVVINPVEPMEEVKVTKKPKANRIRGPGRFRSLEEFNERWVCPLGAKPKVVGMTFQVADVNKPLLAVNRLVEKGNQVCFGPEEQENYVLNKQTGFKIPVYPDGKGSYIMRVQFEGSKEETPIWVDSAADESVCPKNWGHEFKMEKAPREFIFRGANGQVINHHGQRRVKVVSPF